MTKTLIAVTLEQSDENVIDIKVDELFFMLPPEAQGEIFEMVVQHIGKAWAQENPDLLQIEKRELQ